jgi:uncharacterized OsmC-like protein
MTVDRKGNGTVLTNNFVSVAYKEGDHFEINVRDHQLQVDQPVEAGGMDIAPTPTELFIVSLASCVAYYVRRFLARHSLPTESLSVAAAFTMAERPRRVGRIDLSINLPCPIPDERAEALLAVASHCTVHNTLELPPDVTFELSMSKNQEFLCRESLERVS